MKHFIIIKFKENTDKDVLIEETERLFKEVESIDGIKKVEVYTNSIKKPNRFDMMIKITLNKGSLKELEQSRILKEWEDKYNKHIDKKTIFDY